MGVDRVSFAAHAMHVGVGAPFSVKVPGVRRRAQVPGQAAVRRSWKEFGYAELRGVWAHGQHRAASRSDGIVVHDRQQRMNSVGWQDYSQHDSAGWTEQTAEVMAVLGGSRPLKQRLSVERNSTHIPGMISQPPRPVRVAYWWARALQARGWRLWALGEQLAGGGFIAEIGVTGGESIWVVFPRNMLDDGTEASALANFMQRLTFDQRNYLRRLVATGVSLPSVLHAESHSGG